MLPVQQGFINADCGEINGNIMMNIKKREYEAAFHN